MNAMNINENINIAIIIIDANHCNKKPFLCCSCEVLERKSELERGIRRPRTKKDDCDRSV